MHRVVQSISKMFVVLVLLFSSPPPVSLRQVHRRPVIALVSTAHRRGDADPLALARDVAPSYPLAVAQTHQPSPLWWGQYASVPEQEPRVFHPVQAA